MEQIQLVVAAAALFIASFLLVFFKSRNRGNQLPPSPLALPVIGHLHLLSRLPHQSLLKLSHRYGPFMLLRFGCNPTLVVSSADAAKEVLKTHDLVFASRPRTSYSEILDYNGGNLIMAPYGENWRNTRKLCTLELLTVKQVEFFQPVRAAEMSLFMTELSKASESRQAVNLTEKLSQFTFNVIIRMIMGKSHSAKEVRDLVLEMAVVASTAHLGDCIPWLKWLDLSRARMKHMHKRMDEFLQKEIDKHRAKYQSHTNIKDFIDVMLSVSDKGQFENDTMKALILDMVAAGTDTSATTLEWAFAELIRNPQAMAKVQQELDTVFGAKHKVGESGLHKLNYLQAVVKETFRLHPTVPLLVPHESTHECKLTQGYTIPPKTQLLVNAYAIGRDASVWENPLEFNPERFLGANSSIDVRGQNFELIPFGSGRRSCPGMNLALTTVHLVLANLLHGFEWQRTSGKNSEELDMTEGLGFTLMRAHPLQLIPCARTSGTHAL